ncbi:RNA-binding domain-containing protein [Pseudovirgaria hyperparasitica]|uniref:RNA-binding domain-containing protein n=1 Tax=Pseudovirgaria hyperparasitica TaxID=470096 RepID=A0A6A6VXH8_9PEZI|nr:RNA-binding domain-containing protein [Pseudovirgaria hyperparasitica]KAF2754516.1 RNA-binding domain-containing protein [Pseudovirgaria hyperparasitica]
MSPHRKKLKLSDGGVAVPPTKEIAPESDAPITNGEAKVEKPRRSLFVKGLAPETTTDDLTELFSQSFPLKHATAVVDPTSQLCRGYGFVTFADAEDAQRAKEEFKDHILHGKKIRIDVSEPRQRKEKGPPNASRPASGVAVAKEPAKVDNAPRLIIRNLPWSIKTPAQLQKLFQPYGAMHEPILPKKPGTDQLRGFGIVVMKKRKNAQTAIEKLSGKEVDGRTLAVDWAVDKSTWQNLQHNTEAEDDDEDDEEDNDDNNQNEDEADSSDVKGTVIDEDVDDDMENSLSDIDNLAEDGEDMDEDDEDEASETEPPMTTLFVRNLPFSATDESLEDHFRTFGAVRYARIVIDHNLGVPKGTGFVCFYKEEDAQQCLKRAPKEKIDVQVSRPSATKSVLQNVENDTSGHYTMDGRVLHLSQAVSQKDAKRLQTEGADKRLTRDKDKRRLFLLNEGTISTKSTLYQKLSPTEIAMRDASVKQRKTLLQTNPSLNISFVRLAVRNIPRSIDSKALKALAREAVVGFATDVKAGLREPISREELSRGGEEMKKAEKERKKRAVGVVKQAKVVFEGEKGGKVDERSGAGRSRGYGFIEYYTHRNALMGLRWLNGHEVGYKTQEPKKKGNAEFQDRKKRLIVEFAIENAQVVHRRQEREAKHRSDGQDKGDTENPVNEEAKVQKGGFKDKKGSIKDRKAERKDLKRKRGDKPDTGNKKLKPKTPAPVNNAAKVNGSADKGVQHIIARNRHEKRAARKMRNAAQK